MSTLPLGTVISSQLLVISVKYAMLALLLERHDNVVCSCRWWRCRGDDEGNSPSIDSIADDFLLVMVLRECDVPVELDIVLIDLECHSQVVRFLVLVIILFIATITPTETVR